MRGRQATRRRMRALTLLLASALPGCSAIRFGGAAPLAGPWSGSLFIEGQTIATSLLLRDEGDLEALLSAPSLGLEAEGEGSASGEGLALTLAYELTCPGVLTLTGNLLPGPRLAGEVEARDCTGTVQGTFSFRPDGP